jgi:hypothetical protein
MEQGNLPPCAGIRDSNFLVMYDKSLSFTEFKRPAC